ncbi:MAG: iron-sulfur cluster assembly scaffold protein [Thermoplasmatota archaeon]
MSLLDDRMADPSHWGELPHHSGRGSIGNPACGDVLTLYLVIQDDVVREASFESSGSAYQLATASVLCDCVIGQTTGHARKRSPVCVLEKLPDLPENKRYLARLAIDALNRALDDHQRRQDPGEPETLVETLTEQAAEEAILGLLAHERKWGTQEIEALLAAEGQRLPQTPLRMLSALKKQGRIQGEMGGSSYRWWME